MPAAVALAEHVAVAAAEDGVCLKAGAAVVEPNDRAGSTSTDAAAEDDDDVVVV